MSDSPTGNGAPTLSLLETRVLMVLSATDLHGYGIATEIQRRDPDGPRIFPTNLYRRLYDLAARGLIENAGIELDDSGRARKNFRITEAGRSALSCQTEQLSSLVEELRSHAATSPHGSSK